MAPIRSLGQAVTGNHRIEKSNITKSFRNIKKYIKMLVTAHKLQLLDELKYNFKVCLPRYHWNGLIAS
jgi:glutaredoxin-related protein